MPMVLRHECPLPKLVNTADKIMDSGGTWTCPVCVRTWVVTWVNGYGWRTQPQWLCTSAPNAGSVGQQVAALAARKVQPRQALAPVIALQANASVDVTATWDTPFPDDSYLYDALIPAALLGKVAVTPKAQTAAGVVVTVKATAATLVVANLTLIGARWA